MTSYKEALEKVTKAKYSSELEKNEAISQFKINNTEKDFTTKKKGLFSSKKTK